MRLLVVLVPLALSCGGPKISRSIPRDQVGTKYARLTGYFGTSGAAPGGRAEEETPGQIRHEVIRDEATLAHARPSETCFDVAVSTESAYDEPLEQLAPSCELDGSEHSAIVENERVTVADYTFQGMREVVHAEGVAANQFLGLSIARPADKIFRVVTREGRICCAAGGASKVMLALDNQRRELASYNYKLSFEWTLR